MKRPLLIVLPSLVLLVIAAIVTVALADRAASKELAPGTRVAGVDVGGLSKSEALDVLRSKIGAPSERDAKVRVGKETFTLTAQKAGVSINLAKAVDEAYDEGRRGSVVSRAWRKLRGEKLSLNQPAPVTVDRASIETFVGRIHRALARKPHDASLEITVHAVKVTGGQTGRRLGGRQDLVDRMAKSLVDPEGKRLFRARMVEVPPKVGEKELFERTPVAVTVSKSEKRVRVFKKGKLVKSYNVAVGQPEWPTPEGQFVVQTMQVNPAWNVPDSEWAGDMAGKVVPGGDPANPLVARWIGFNGSVGFHGTKSIDSLGTAASHGCVRMNPTDVIDLYERVKMGTPVLVAA